MKNEEKILEILANFSNAVEAAAADMRHRIAEIMGVTEPAIWSPEKIVWQECQGEKGPYDRSEDVNNLQFKAMLRDLNNHGGKMNRKGHFYWVFRNGSTVGRKKR